MQQRAQDKDVTYQCHIFANQQNRDCWRLVYCKTVVALMQCLECCVHLQAQDYATKAIDLQPNSQQALLALVYIQLCRGNSNAALTLLRQQHVPA